MGSIQHLPVQDPVYGDGGKSPMNSHPQKLALKEKKEERKTSYSNLGQILLVDKAQVRCSEQQREAGNANSWQALQLD